MSTTWTSQEGATEQPKKDCPVWADRANVRMDRVALVAFFDSLHNDTIRLMKNKNADYATQEDVFSNLRRGGLFGVAVRLDDKVSRLLNMSKPGASDPKVDESIEDTLRDIYIYAGLALAMRSESA